MTVDNLTACCRVEVEGAVAATRGRHLSSIWRLVLLVLTALVRSEGAQPKAHSDAG